MISRLVTVDLLVTAVTRIHSQLPQDARGDPAQLFNPVLEILNRWAHKIESQGLSVSLDCILDNVFWLKTRQQYVDADFAELGLQLIANVPMFDSLLAGSRLTSDLANRFMEAMEKALESPDKVSLHEAAKIITELKNSTEAAKSCRKFLNWFNSVCYIRDSLSPKVKAVIEKVLSEPQAGKSLEIPRGLAVELRREYLSFKAATKD